MFKILYTIPILLFLNGCLSNPISYNSTENKKIKNQQYIEKEECNYLIGPFIVKQGYKTLEDLKEKTIKEAKEQGFYGNNLINIKFEERIKTLIIGSKLCLHIEGNLIEDKNKI